jgi:galactokinase
VSVSTFRSKYERRLPESLSGAEILSTKSIHPDPFTTIRPDVVYRVRDCTRYAIEENHRIELFVDWPEGVPGSLRCRPFARWAN